MEGVSLPEGSEALAGPVLRQAAHQHLQQQVPHIGLVDEPENILKSGNNYCIYGKKNHKSRFGSVQLGITNPVQHVDAVIRGGDFIQQLLLQACGHGGALDVIVECVDHCVQLLLGGR